MILLIEDYINSLLSYILVIIDQFDIFVVYLCKGVDFSSQKHFLNKQ